MTLDTIVNIAKRRGFIQQSSEIYGGFSSSYDYGPLGAELKNHIKRAWWHATVYGDEDVVGLDSAILMNPVIWEASGHLGAGFADPLVECTQCHRRFRTDTLEKEACPECGGTLTEERRFNLMMKTFVGPVEDTASPAYLRPETAQGIYVNFPWVTESMRRKLPFGIAQIGKAFRNEITPGHFTYRMREFEQMEMQWFFSPEEKLDTADTEPSEHWFDLWKKKRMQWYVDLGIDKERLRFHEHGPDELAHYAKKAVDIEFRFPEPLGWKELEGIHHRGDWDLSRHGEFSKKPVTYFDEATGERIVPHVVETSAGVDRCALAFLCAAHEEIDGGRGDGSTHASETVLRFHPRLAPVKVAILPLVKNKEPIVTCARQIARTLQTTIEGVIQYDESGSIGRRYRRQDEIGTPLCITVDFDSIENNDATVRERDSMQQERVALAELPAYIQEYMNP